MVVQIFHYAMILQCFKEHWVFQFPKVNDKIDLDSGANMEMPSSIIPHLFIRVVRLQGAPSISLFPSHQPIDDGLWNKMY
jgi:hypothetical protein